MRAAINNMTRSTETCVIINISDVLLQTKQLPRSGLVALSVLIEASCRGRCIGATMREKENLKEVVSSVLYFSKRCRGV